jgi:putative ABC transport system permease protein
MPNASERPLPAPGSGLLRAFARLVPSSHRSDWLAEWSAEVTHAWTEQEDDLLALRLRLRCVGAVVDALWLRRHYNTSSRRTSMLAHDIRYAARTLVRKPGFTAVVVGTLALCIGANTAIFSVVNSVLLHGLPYANLDRLVSVWSNDTRSKRERNNVSIGDYRDLRARTKTLSQVAAYFPTWNATFTAPDVAEHIDVGVVSANFLSVLGVAPAIGRGFIEAEDEPGAPRTVILTRAFWSRRFNEDPSVIGRSVTLDGQPYTVIGVMGGDFPFPDSKVDVVAPITMLGDFLDRRGVHIVDVIGRLRSGASVEDAQRELSGIAKQLEQEHPTENAGFGATVLPLRTALLGDVRGPLLVLFAAVCAVLLIGCANVANLMLARAASRQQELAVRSALGAEPGAIVRQLLTESALIALIAGLLGIGIAVVATQALARLIPPTIARIASIQISGSVLVFTLVVSLVAAILCGLAPALRGASVATHATLKDSARGARTRARRRFQAGLVVVELSLSLVLAVSAGLLINSFRRLSNADPGFRADHLVKMKIELVGPNYRQAAPRGQFFAALLDRARALPGVQAVGAVSRFPLFDGNLTTTVTVEGGSAVPAEQLPDFDYRLARGDYFAAMGIPLVSGRAFTWTERTDSGSTPVAILNRSAATLLFGDRNPIGARVKMGGPTAFEVVGVVGDIHDASMRAAPRPQIYASAQQLMPSTLTVVLRCRGGSGAVLAGMRAAMTTLDPALPLFAVQTIDEVMATANRGDQFTTLLLSAFSTLALLLAAVGTYGVIAFGVSERTREIGVRMALGAQSSGVLRMVLREGLVLLALALPMAALGVWAASRGIRGLLFGVSPVDPMTVTAAVGMLLGATLLACYLPARRAASVDPLIAIRGVE